MEVSANCGFLARFKGKHDGFFGFHKHVFDAYVSSLLDRIFEEQGLGIHCEEFMPQERSC